MPILKGEQRAQKLASIGCPSCVILAEQDRMTPTKEGLKLAQNLNTQAQVVEEIGTYVAYGSSKTKPYIMKTFIQSVEK